MRILVVSSRLTERRRGALTRLVAAEGEPVLVPPAALEASVDGNRPQAVLLDGPLDPPAPEVAGRLEVWVEAGTSLVAVGTATAAGPAGGWVDVLRATAQPPVPPGEVFVGVAEPDHPLVARVDAEFPVADVFQPLSPAHDAMGALLQVTYRFCNQGAVLAGDRGQGLVVVSGLGNTDAALAVPALATVLRRALRGRERLRPAGRPLGVGIVGYGGLGGMGRRHGTAAGATAGLELVAACDTDPARRKAAEHDFAGIRVHTSVEELAADGAVDVAMVATPPVAHMSIVAALLRAGKHVVCEKPLCFTVAQADRLFALAREHDRTLTVHQSRRWDRDFRAVRRAVDEGLLGEVFNTETFVGGFDHPCRAWHSEAAVSGGLAYDWGAHHVDWILLLMGSVPARVWAVGHKRVWHDVTNLDQLRVRMRWDDGREAEYVASDVAAVRRPKFYVQGTAGTLVGHYRPVTFDRIDPARGYVSEAAHHAEAPADLTVARYRGAGGLEEMSLPLEPEVPFAFHRNLANHLHLGEPLAVEPQSVREVVAVLEAATRSAAEGGQPVDFR
ncbi:MAG TPA: Gfo/Idh/MocA family oxidoreductase [Acidimicrobiales bacterium]|nr:Gfo/Idh/MocA family oxidoreductase [Acidimicrobiales bacterium]